MAINLVEQTLLKHLKNGAPLEAWLEKSRMTITGQRLALCLAIDLELRAISAADIDPLINSLPATEFNLGAHFARFVAAHPEKSRLHQVSARTLMPPEDDVYVRVMLLTSFETHYLPHIDYGLDYPELVEIQKLYFPSDILNSPTGKSLGFIKESWSGENDIIWVSTLADLKPVLEKSPQRMGGAANDALGLGYPVERDSVPFLVAVKYPAKCGIRCSRPNSFVAKWDTDSSYYLSSGRSDGWGETASCTGAFLGRRERIHDSVHGLSADFQGFSIGPVDEIYADPIRLLKEGTERLEQCIVSR